jgi:hypothetical protein
MSKRQVSKWLDIKEFFRRHIQKARRQRDEFPRDKMSKRQDIPVAIRQDFQEKRHSRDEMSKKQDAKRQDVRSKMFNYL